MFSGTYITRPGGRRAFSLIELLVVIAIMLILTVLAVGAYANFNKARSVRLDCKKGAILKAKCVVTAMPCR